MLPEIIFWCLTAFVAYTYVGYPLLLYVAARLWGRRIQRGTAKPSVSLVLAVYNEEQNIARRLDELLGQIANAGVEGEVIVVSDGSTDGTVGIARSFAGRGIQVIDLPRNGGKAAALSRGCADAVHDVLVFADARQRWDADALRLLVENFADPEVGAATGDLVIESRPGVLAGVGLYWRFEKMLRRTESHLYSMVGVTGAISAVRRELFHAIPPGTLLDDVYWPLRVAMSGYRVIHDSRARAFDRLPDRVQDEFRRKVRTLTGNYQLVARLPESLLPWRNRICWQFLSHKLFRLVVPWALMTMLPLSLLATGPVYTAAFCLQAGCYGLALLGLTPLGGRSRLISAAASFLVLNSAAWLAFWEFALRQTASSWKKVRYEPIHNQAAATPALCSSPSAATDAPVGVAV